MPEAFDPYYVWLGIPPKERPANYYRLLGVTLLESNPDVIDNAADRQTAHLRTLQTGKNGKLAERLLNEVATARVCLLDAKKKATYDERLQARVAAQSPPSAHQASQPPRATSLPVAERLAGENWDEMPAAGESKPHQAGGKPGSAIAAGRMGNNRPIALFAAAGALLVAMIGIGLYALNSKPADGALTFDWPADGRTGVALSVDDVPVPIPATGRWEYRCRPGEHRIVALRPLYQPWNATVTVAEDKQQTVAVDWKPQAVVALDWPLEDRGGAGLEIDGRLHAPSDRVPLELFVEPGQHVVRITRPAVDPFQVTVAIALDGRRTIVVPPPVVERTLVIQWPDDQRKDAQLSIDGQVPTADKSDAETLEFALKPGRHTVRIIRPGFQPFEQVVELATADNKPLLPTWTLEPAQPAPVPVKPEVAVTSTPAPSSPPDETPALPAKKRPIPPADEQAKSAKQINDFYKPTHSAKDLAKASEFYDLAGNADETPAERYMLFLKGAEMAEEAGDLTLAFRGIDLLAAEYEIEPLEAKQKLLDKGVGAVATAEQAKALIAAANELLDQAVAADRHDTALAIAASASKALNRRSVDARFHRETEDSLVRRRRDIHMLQPLWAKAQEAQKILDENAADGDANLTMGRWYCFYKADWPRGLPLLAKASDERLKTMAQTELKPPSDAKGQAELADAWWDASQKETPFVRDALRLHAGDLYQAALPNLTSALTKEAIGKRLAEVTDLRGALAPVAIGTASGPVKFPRGQWVDILKLVDPARDTVKGNWSRQGTEILCDPDENARIEVPVVIEGGYDLEVEFTRFSGNDDVDTIIPVGSHECNVEINSGQKNNGLVTIDGRYADNPGNPTADHAVKLENGHRYRVLISVRRSQQGRASVDVALDRQPLFPHWEGNESSLAVPSDWEITHPGRPGLATWKAHAIFHSMRLRMVSGQASVVGAVAEVANPPTNVGSPSAKPSNQLTIVSARWGGGSNWSDVAERVREAVAQGATAYATTDFLKADPTPGWRKQLQITAEKGGRQHSIELNEGKSWTRDDYASPLVGPVTFLRRRWVPLLPLVNATGDAVNGRWSRNGAEIVCERDEASRIELPVAIDGGYDLEVEFTRTDGKADVNVLFPVGSHRCNATLSGNPTEESVSGLDTVDRRSFYDPQNPTIKRPGSLENGRPYRVVVGVRLFPDDKASVDVLLDGKPYLLHWTGDISSLGVRDSWSLPDAKRPGLGVYESRVIFHSVRLRMITGQATSDTAAP